MCVDVIREILISRDKTLKIANILASGARENFDFFLISEVPKLYKFTPAWRGVKGQRGNSTDVTLFMTL